MLSFCSGERPYSRILTWSCQCRWGETHEFVGLSTHQAAVDAFKAQWLYPHIAACDAAEQVFDLWTRSVNDRNFHFSEWQDGKYSRRSFKKAPARSAGTHYSGPCVELVELVLCQQVDSDLRNVTTPMTKPGRRYKSGVI